VRRQALPPSVAAGALALLAAPLTSSATAAPLTISGWPEITARLSGSSLVWAATVTNRLRGFDYWATEVSRVRLGRSGPRGPAETPVAVRTQAGPLGPVALSTGPDGSFALLARGQGFPPPVIWCCDARGLEVVMESDGRETAPRALAAGVDGARVRMLLATPDAVRLVSDDPLRVTDDPAADRARARPRVEAAFPGRPRDPLVVIAGRQAAWIDSTAPTEVRTGTLTDAGVVEGPPLRQPGTVVGLWIGAPSTVVAASRTAGGVEVARHDLPAGTRRVVFRGSRVPPLAAGGGVLAVADGRRVLAGRGALAEVRRTSGAVAALATDGRRLAIFERLTGRRGARGTAVRLARVAG
jgi:hypothetical protein